MKSKLIVIDGLDGSGKSTQFEMIRKKLEQENIPCTPISFPEYDKPSSTLVKMYLNGEISPSPDGVNPFAASTFYAADRYISYKLYWEKEYNSGNIILASRYVSSNAIHQMSKLPEEKWDGFLEWLEDYEYNRLGLPKPDKVIFLDMPLEISRRLISSRYGGDETKRDIHEADAEYLRKCRLTALYSAKKCGWKIIDCSNGDEPLPVDVIFNKLVDEISDLIYQNLCS